jgi:uncharacterized protein (DUF433 family)
MSATLTTFHLPLRLDDHGTIRIGQSRVTLETVIEAFGRGESPETIARQFPAVTLAEVYGTIAYYLQHQQEMDAYLQARAAAAEPLLRELAERFNPVGLREQLQARQAAQRQHGE